MKRNLTISYSEYETADELSQEEKQLLEAAKSALDGSYAPYSNFHVGAAVLLADGTVVKGSNQENAAYPSGLCAERTAMFSASALHPDLPFKAIAVVASQEKGRLTDTPAAPCGSCLQVMAEYQHKFNSKIKIILGSENLIRVFDQVESLLPFIFDNL